MDFKNSFLFPLIQSVHLAGIALLVGSIAWEDLEVLGVTVKPQSDRLGPWTWSGLAVMAVTGPLLFLADTQRYWSNPAFRVKMLFLLAALILHFTVRRKPTKWTAVFSIALWTCVVLSGRAIADFDV